MNFSIRLYRYFELSHVAQKWANDYIPLHDFDVSIDDIWFISDGKPVDSDIIDAGQLCAPSATDAHQEAALAQVFEYLLLSEQAHFVESPSQDHIYFQLLVALHGLRQAREMLSQLQ